MILLDTNVVSELMRPAPAKPVLDWLDTLTGVTFATTSITEAELRFGAAIMPLGARRTALLLSIERIMARDFAGRVLPFDQPAAPHFASFLAARRAAGRPIKNADAMIAAIALARRVKAIATRNIRDFEGCGLPLVDPWQPRA